jgi:hypothetical protein
MVLGSHLKINFTLMNGEREREVERGRERGREGERGRDRES